jgi:hypothetical protein
LIPNIFFVETFSLILSLLFFVAVQETRIGGGFSDKENPQQTQLKKSTAQEGF